MARMLQALKNLEARSKKPAAAGGLLGHLADNAGRTKPPAQPAANPAQPAPNPAPPAPNNTALVPVYLQAQDVAADSAAPVVAAPPAKPQPAPPPAIKRDRFGINRPPANLERAVRRTLTDSSRAQPFQQLAHRLARDVEQTDSKTLLWISIGESRGGYESLLHSAALLAEALEGPTLLIDADLGRRSLSGDLDYGQLTGLAELLKNDERPQPLCRPTAFERLSLLPAGRASYVDLLAGPRLENLLQELAGEYSLLLIDGGRSSDAAAAALARVSDATYFVVQLGVVEGCAAQAALRDFRAAGAKVLGCVAT